MDFTPLIIWLFIVLPALYFIYFLMDVFGE